MARPSLARRLGAVAVLASLVATTSACGGGEDTAGETSSTESGSDSGSESGETGSEEPDASGDLEELSAEEFYPAVIGALQEAETAAFSITTTAQGSEPNEITGVMEYGDDGISMEATSTGAQAMEMIMVDKTLYMSGEAMPAPDGKKWIKIDMSDPNSLFGMLGKSTDPEFMFEAMSKPKSFTLVGTEDVDGEPTNRYEIVVDSAAYMEAMDLPAEMGQFMPEEITTEMWVDSEDRPRKFLQELEQPDPSGNGTMNTTTEGTYSDFGLDTEIEAPPAGEVSKKGLPGM